MGNDRHVRVRARALSKMALADVFNTLRSNTLRDFCLSTVVFTQNPGAVGQKVALCPGVFLSPCTACRNNILQNRQKKRNPA
jgi:hypothetical protein